MISQVKHTVLDYQKVNYIAVRAKIEPDCI